MMMSLSVDRASASRGVGDGAKGRLIGEERLRGKRGGMFASCSSERRAEPFGAW